MQCAYCGVECRPTREHVISSAILDLFPECYLTFDGERKKIHQGDPLVKDVCAKCNNDYLSYIDEYAKNFIGKYFVDKYEEDDELEVEYEYTMIQKMLLKFAFNDLRANCGDISFFDDKIKDFLLNESMKEPLKKVTILAGLAVNTSPVPDFMFGNLKLRWNQSPVFIKNSLLKGFDYFTGQIYRCEKDEIEIQRFEGLALSYIFRFNSGQLILMCWEDDIEDLESILIGVQYSYPYAILKDYQSSAKLKQCVNELTYHRFQIVDSNYGNAIFRDIAHMRSIANGDSKKIKFQMEAAWEAEEKALAKKYKRK